MNNSEFLPSASSTIKKRKYRQSEDEDYDFHQQINTKKEGTFVVEQRGWARNSIKTANNVAGIPSKYFKADFSNSETKMTSFNETTISDSDLLNSRSSLLNDYLIHPNPITDNNIAIVNFISDYSYMFKSEEEAAEMLLADELSWKQKNEWPIQKEQFSDFNCCDKVSLGEYFSEKCNTLSDFIDAKSPKVTRLPVALIEPCFSSVEENICKQDNKSFTASYNSPKEAVDYLHKLRAKPQRSLFSQTKINSLPERIDSFYETCGSENKEQEQIYNKENFNSLNSDISQNLHLALKNYNLPLETTATDLVWGCIKVGKSVSQEFFIRNNSAKRIGLQLSLSNPQFKLKESDNRDSESISTDKIILQPNKSKSVIVSFVPTNIGAAVGELYFTPLDPTLNQLRKQCIKLYGYGGLFKVDFHNLTRDIAGKYWLFFGKLDERTVLTTRFNVKNKGDVPAFVHISINSLDSTKIQVSPNFFVLALREDKEIVVSYKPSNEDYYLFKSVYSTKVVDLGNLKITFGSEVDRGRIRNICKKCVEKGLNIAPIAHILEEKIKEEMMPKDLIKFREPAHSLKDMVSLLNHQYINLTLERDPQEPAQLQQFSKNSNEYQPLYQESTITTDQNSYYYCNVVPTLLILTLPYKHKDTIFLKSSKKQKLNFIASCQYSDLDLKPREGILEPYDTVMITVKYSSEFTVGKKLFTVLVIVENEIFEVNVKVEYLGYEKNKSKSLFSCIL